MKIQKKNQSKSSHLKTRKEQRKERRMQKKTNRFNYHNKKKINVAKKTTEGLQVKKKYQNLKQGSDEEDDEEIPSDDEMIGEVVEPVKKSPALSKIETHVSNSIATEEKYFKSLKSRRVEQLKKQNQDEDKTIKKYEKLLKLNRKGKTNSGSTGKFNDGLDYLLELCTDDGIENMYKAAKETDQMCKNKPVDDIDRKKKLKEIETKYLGDDEDFFNNFSDGDEEDNSEDENMDQDDETEENQMNSGEDQDDLESESSECESEDSVEIAAEKSKKGNEKGKLWEDIYGRTRDREGNVLKTESTKYVPPHLRKVDLDSQASEKFNNLRRQIKGLMNRLAESNLHRICIDIERLFNENPRHDVNSCLTEIIFDSLVTNVMSKERHVLENILLVSVLHANIGSEIGAYFLEKLVLATKEQLDQIETMRVEDKTCDNLILILCCLYMLKVVGQHIVYELLDQLCSPICEKSIDCIIIILKNVGIFLRKDDPVRLKEFIHKVQSLVASNTISEDQRSRQSFMLDILMAVKNNNIAKIPNFDQELLEHFRKLQKQFIRPGQYVSSLNVTMSDILKADTNGRWWLVGSAWLQKDSSTTEKAKAEAENSNGTENNDALARKHKMNTDEKRNVFHILMSSEDYLDAFEKLMSTSKNERVVVAVVIHCLTSEKIYNPFYNFISQKLCESSRKYILAFQYSLWDKIKEMKHLSIRQSNHLSNFICFLISTGLLPLSVLKIIEFEQMESVFVKFLRKVMFGIFLTEEEKFHTIFQRVSHVKQLKSFKDQLRLFLKIFLLDSKSFEKLAECEKEKIKTRLNLADKYLIAKMLS